MLRPAPILVAGRFPALLSRLLDLLSGLSPQEWDLPALPPRWTVKDVALHLLGDDLGLLSGRRDGYSYSPRVQSFAGWDELVGGVNASNQRWVEAARGTSPRLLCDLLKFTGDQVSAYFLSLDGAAIGGPVSWAGPQPAPVWLDIAREFTERWHHQQHIREAAGKPGLMEPEYLAPVLATFAHALPRTYRQADAPEGAGVTLTITGESGGVWSILREQGAWQLYAGRPPAPQAEVILPEQAAWRLFTRGLSAENARAEAVLLGDGALGVKLFEMVSIIA